MNVNFDRKFFAPVYWHIEAALKDPSIRKILVYGGSSSSKTYSIAQSSVINALAENNSTLIFRKESTTIDDSVYSDFKKLANWINEHVPSYFEILSRIIRHQNGRFTFRGLDDPEKLKGIAGYKRIFFNELSKFDESDWDEANRRLRGLPNQKIIADWNPIDETHWIKTEIIDKDTWLPLPNYIQGHEDAPLGDTSWKKINETGDTILIKTSYIDNYWVVGSPCGTYGYVDKHSIKNFEDMRTKKPNQYMVYGLGEWGSFRVGGEFWKQFNIDKHVQKVELLKDKSIHISIDVNRYPYISQTTWQINNKELRQFNELCATDPENTAKKAAQKVARYLDDINYMGVVYIYGDASGKNKSATDNNSFFDLYILELKKYCHVEDRIMKVNPSVQLSAAFINDIYEGNSEFSILIGDNCKLSVVDYNTVKEGKDGEMVKERITDTNTGITYEKNGHLSDAKRYFICNILAKEYKDFIIKRKKYVIL